ncbi:acyl-CoA dehydrogenase NM domain-like protein [Colletotrichum somersetense]|nr:acyl-CoA dehydrogenase NM domain-like protein [Colletotrichum somersetense]
MKPLMSSEIYITEPYGNRAPFPEPAWYNALASPHYEESHRRVHDHNIEDHISPNILDWEEKGHVPDEARLHFARAGLIYPDLPEGYRWDVFHSLVVSYELSRIWAAGVSAGMSGVSGETTIGVPLVIHHGGSDLANLRATAIKSEDGGHHVVNEHKKWITGALRATRMTTAVRTGGPGMGGISVLVTPLDLPRKCQQTTSSGKKTLDFNRERFILAVFMNGQARICLEDAWAYAMDRQTFGKPPIAHRIIRHKLVAMARYVESHWAWLEQIAYHTRATGSMGTDLASRIALAKVHGGRLLELVSREAQQIFGGAGYQRGGVEMRVEQISRDSCG